MTHAGFPRAILKASIPETRRLWGDRAPQPRGVLIAELGFLVSSRLGISTGGDTHHDGHSLSKRVLFQTVTRGQKGETD